MKFRVWDKKYKDWLQDDRVGIDGVGIFLIYKSNGMVNSGAWMREGDYDDNFIIQQFIGLTDVKGNEVYEGDIIRDKRGEVTVVEQKKEFSCGCCGYVYGYAIDHHGYEVIGNVCENRDLLKE